MRPEIIILILAFILQAHCLQLTDFCSLGQNNLNETTSQCGKRYTKCTETVCSIDKKSCDEFKVLLYFNFLRFQSYYLVFVHHLGETYQKNY